MHHVAAQLADLTAEDFLCQTPWQWLKHYPRYFQAISLRLDKAASGGGARDRQGLAELDPFQRLQRERAGEHQARSILDAELTMFRWMLEEFRVSLFAQQLGTSMSISAKRLEKQWAKVRPA